MKHFKGSTCDNSKRSFYKEGEIRGNELDDNWNSLQNVEETTDNKNSYRICKGEEKPHSWLRMNG